MINNNYYDCEYELANEMCDLCMLDDEQVCLIADYDIAEKVLKCIFMYNDEDFSVKQIADFGDGECDGYEGPYLVELQNGEVWVQKGLNDDGTMLGFEAESVYMEPKYLKYAIERNMYEGADYYPVHIGEEEPCEDEEDSKMHLLFDQDDVPCGFEYEDEGNGYCLHFRYCECEPDVKKIVEMYNDITGSLVKYFR